MITVVFSLNPGSGEHRVEKILEWKNFAQPEDRFDAMDETILGLEQKYAGQRQVSSRNAENLLTFFQQNPQFSSPQPGEGDRAFAPTSPGSAMRGQA